MPTHTPKRCPHVCAKCSQAGKSSFRMPVPGSRPGEEAPGRECGSWGRGRFQWWGQGLNSPRGAPKPLLTCPGGQRATLMDWGPALAPCRWRGWARQKEACPLPPPPKGMGCPDKKQAWEAGLRSALWKGPLGCREAHGRERDRGVGRKQGLKSGPGHSGRGSTVKPFARPLSEARQGEEHRGIMGVSQCLP